MTAMPTDGTIRKSNQHYPWWLNNLADDVTGEGAATQGVLQGAENVFWRRSSGADRLNSLGKGNCSLHSSDSGECSRMRHLG
jgi:hypothetical protein